MTDRLVFYFDSVSCSLFAFAQDSPGLQVARMKQQIPNSLLGYKPGLNALIFVNFHPKISLLFKMFANCTSRNT